MFTFDWTVSVGNLLTIGSIAIACIWAFARLQAEVRIVRHDQKATDFKINIIGESINQLTSILTRVAVQDERLNSFEHRIEVAEADVRDIQHGKGYVTEAISGEYTRHGKVK